MSQVTVYRFRRYDIISDGHLFSRRWATREAAEAIGAEVLEQTAVEVDAAAVASDIPGMTVAGSDPLRGSHG